MPLTGVATQKGWNPPEKEISRRNGGKGVDKEKCSNKRSLLAKTGELAGMYKGNGQLSNICARQKKTGAPPS